MPSLPQQTALQRYFGAGGVSAFDWIKAVSQTLGLSSHFNGVPLPP